MRRFAVVVVLSCCCSNFKTNWSYIERKRKDICRLHKSHLSFFGCAKVKLHADFYLLPLINKMNRSLNISCICALKDMLHYAIMILSNEVYDASNTVHLHR